MWTGLIIILVLLALMVYLKTRPPPPVPVLTDTPLVPTGSTTLSLGNDPVLADTPLVPTAPPNFAGGPPLNETASWAGGRRPIRRPSTQAPHISIPLIRWAQRRFEAGNRTYTGDGTGPTDQSYWQALDILRTVEQGGWFVVPNETGVDMYERYEPPFGQMLPRAEANPAAVPGAWQGPMSARPQATPAVVIMSEL